MLRSFGGHSLRARLPRVGLSRVYLPRARFFASVPTLSAAVVGTLSAKDEVESKEEMKEMKMVCFPKADELRKCYQQEMKDEMYLAEKTVNTIVNWAAGKQVYEETAIPVISAYAVSDFQAMFTGKDTRSITAVAVLLNEEMHMKKIQEALRKCSRPVNK